MRDYMVEDENLVSLDFFVAVYDPDGYEFIRIGPFLCERDALEDMACTDFLIDAYRRDDYLIGSFDDSGWYTIMHQEVSR